MIEPKIYPELVRKLLDDAEDLSKNGAWEKLHDNVRPIIEQLLMELESMGRLLARHGSRATAWREAAKATGKLVEWLDDDDAASETARALELIGAARALDTATEKE